MSKYAIDLEITKCVACGACVIACYDQNDIDIKNGQPPLRNIFELEEKKEKETVVHYLSISCMHCDNSPCITACPSGCIYKDPDTNLTIYNNTNCISGHSCALACPYEIPTFNLQGKMQKCDGCYMRIKYGYQPACNKVCPTNALRLVEVENNPIKEENSLRAISKKQLGN